MKANSNNGPETSGLTKKSFTQLQKLAMVLCCTRETIEFNEPHFTVIGKDVTGAWTIIQMSMETYKYFKIQLSIEMGEIDIEEIGTEFVNPEEVELDFLVEHSFKLKQLYELADDNNEVLLSVVRRNRLWPTKTKGVNAEIFAQILVRFGVAQLTDKLVRKKDVQVLKLLNNTEDETLISLYEMMFKKMHEKNIIFDPLNKFQE